MVGFNACEDDKNPLTAACLPGAESDGDMRSVMESENQKTTSGQGENDTI